MDRRAVDGPYPARYESLAGDEDERLLLYLLCSRLGLSVSEAKALPWWEYDLLIEGIAWDLERQANLAGAGGEETEHVDDVADLGFNVRSVD